MFVKFLDGNLSNLKKEKKISKIYIDIKNFLYFFINSTKDIKFEKLIYLSNIIDDIEILKNFNSDDIEEYDYPDDFTIG